MKIRMLLLCCLGLLSLSLNASERSFTYYGQNSERVELEAHKKEIQLRDQVVNETCTRQVPYTERECRPVTRTRQECQTIPAYEDCRMVPETQCRNETRYRQECRMEPGQRVCRMEPGERICRPGQGREVCVTRNNGARICTTQPGPDVCTNGPSRQVCDQQPAQRVCNNVPYTERVCETVNRRQCSWVPARQECRNVPYTVNECQDVTRHRNEQYACSRTIQVPVEVITHTFTAEVLVNFQGYSPVKNATVTVRLSDEGEISQEISGVNPSNFVAVSSERTERRSLGFDSTLVKRELRVQFANIGNLKTQVEQGPKDVRVTRQTVNFRLGLPVYNELGATLENLTNVKVTVIRRSGYNQSVVLDRVFRLTELPAQRLGDDVRVLLDFANLGVNTNVGGSFEIRIENQVDLSALTNSTLILSGQYQTTAQF
jgi:hypothetical protein